MIANAVVAIGEWTIHAIMGFVEAIRFSLTCLGYIFHRSSYNPAMNAVLVRQIYFTALQILPLFLVLGVLFGSIIIGSVVSLAVEFSLQSQIGTILVGFIVNEFAPLFTALLIALRSGSAINTEIAVMKVNNELNTLKAFHINVMTYLFLPRILGGMVSIIILAALFAIIMLGSGYIFSAFFLQMGLQLYLQTLVQAFAVNDILVFTLKCLAFGFVSMLIPIYSGLKTDKAFTAIPVSVLNGMVRIFIAIFFVEVFSLLLRLL